MASDWLLYVEEAPWAFGGRRISLDSARYVVVGAPLDATASHRSGQRWGPWEIRRASAFIEFNSLRTGLDVDAIPIGDVGDVTVAPGDVHATLEAVRRVVEGVSGRAIPIVLGGEHTVTLAAVQGVAGDGEPPCLVVFDAHFDLRSEYLGSRLSHATFMRRLIETKPPKRIVYVGVRGFSMEEMSFASSSKSIRFYTVRDVMSLGEASVAASARRAIAECEKVYVSIDMDVLDPAYAPGVGNPEPEGLTTFSLYEILSGVIDERLVGLDVVEVAPPHDCSGITSIAAAKAVVEAVAAAEAARSRRPSGSYR